MLVGDKICWLEIRSIQSTQLRSDLKVSRILPPSCARGVFQKLPMSRENRARRWIERLRREHRVWVELEILNFDLRWCQGQRVWVEPEFLGAWPKVMSGSTSQGWTRVLRRLIWGWKAGALGQRSNGGRSLIVSLGLPRVVISLRGQELTTIPTPR